ncbi:MAG: nucleotidyltransferase family protein [Actinomycetes bacterium]
MSSVTEETLSLRAAIESNRVALDAVLGRYGATNPRIFGSVARGDARSDSDLDILVDLDADGGNSLLRIAGIGEEFSRILGVRVDVVTGALLRDPVSTTVRRDAVAL